MCRGRVEIPQNMFNPVSMNGDKTPATRGRLQLAPKNNVY
jgi:hypothetical protein